MKKSPILITSLVFAAMLGLAACASNDKPHVIQASTDSPYVTLNSGMATQIEMPDAGHVQSVVVGNPDMVTATQDQDVVNLMGKGKGETNLIIRSRTSDGDVKVYQYRVTVQ